MVKRIVFGLLCASGGVLMLFLRNTFLFAIAAMVVCFLAVYELNHAVKLQNKPIMVLSLVVGTSFPLYYEYGDKLQGIGLNLKAEYLLGLYVLLLFIFMLFEYEKTKFEDVAAVIISSLGLPYAVTRLLYFRDIADYFPDRGYTTYHGLFLILFAMFSAWLTDTFAYFTGSFLGKHKMCPNISPKKTYEGAIGGVIGCVISNVVLYAVFENFVFENPVNNYLAVVLMSVALSVISMCGDLTASVVKRNFGIKDFGNLVPGHGGVMDRFDSEVFVLVAFYAIFNIFEVSI